MKVGDVIRTSGIWRGLAASIRTKSSAADGEGEIGLLVRIGKRHNNRPVGTVLTSSGIETWPLDPHYEYEVINGDR